jgi:hypothetical protein
MEERSMSLQLWFLEDIENILWATQAVMQSTVAALASTERPDEYKQGFKQGFETGIQHIIQAFDAPPLAKDIWFRESLKETLLAVRTITLPTVAIPKGPVDYNQGFDGGLDVALWCVATSFGINLLSLETSSSPQVGGSSSRHNYSTLFHDDIKNILLAIEDIMLTTVAAFESEIQRMDYNCGFEAALRCIAQLFGIKWWIEESSALSLRVIPSSLDTFWLCKDVENKLLMIYGMMRTVKTTSQANDWAVSYWQGFETALRCIAASFGLNRWQMEKASLGNPQSH